MAHIFQISVSDGGVPKLPVSEATVTGQGLNGDRQRDLKHHGGPDQALCLYSLERITALQREGHPIYPGSTGENLTLTGLDWTRVVPGTRLRLGPEVKIEITDYATPCATIAGSFADGRSVRAGQDQHPGWSRVYARVLRAGTLRIGAEVEVVAPEEGTP